MTPRKPKDDSWDDAVEVRLYTDPCEVDLLVWYEADSRRLEHKRFPLIRYSLERSFINLLCRPRHKNTIDDLVAAYRLMTKLEGRHELRAFIGEQRILNRLALPLRDAKSAFIVGNYLGTIAMCGLIAETVAILLFDLSESGLDSTLVRATIDKELGPKGKDRTFEGLGQSRRISVLKKLKLLTPRQVSWLNTIAGVRKKQLHFLSEPMPTEEDTLKVYLCALRLIQSVIRQPGDKSRLSINRKLHAQLDRRGKIRTVFKRKPVEQSNDAS